MSLKLTTLQALQSGWRSGLSKQSSPPRQVSGHQRRSEMVALGEAVGPIEPSRAYTTYLTIIALAGWALTSYDMNLLVLTIPDIAQDLGLSQSQVGSLVFFVTAAQFVVARSEEHTSELQSLRHLVCRLLLEKK